MYTLLRIDRRMASAYKLCCCPTSPYTGSRYSGYLTGSNHISGWRRRIGEIAATFFEFLKTANLMASNSNVFDVSFNGKYKCGDAQPEVVTSHWHW